MLIMRIDWMIVRKLHLHFAVLNILLTPLKHYYTFYNENLTGSEYIKAKYIIAFDLYVWKTLHQTLYVAHMYIKSETLITVQVRNLTYQQVKTI